MSELDKIIVKYDADISELKAELTELKRQLASVEKTAKDSSNKVKTDFKAAEQGIQSTTRATTNLGIALNKTNAEFIAVSKSAQNVRKNINEIEVKATNPLSESVSNLGKKIAATFAVGTLLAFAKEAINVTAKMQGLTTQLNFITGSNEQGAESFSKLRLLVDRLGLELISTTEAYTKFAGAATKSGLTLSQVDDIFENVAIAAKAMNLTAEDTSGVFLALQQMISKGTVSAEELRGQLAERLPGAFSIAAKSVGVTEQALGKMMEQGQIVSREFLPAFSQQLRDTFEGAMGDATTSLTSNLNRMTNAWTEFKTSTGALLAPIVEGMARTAIEIQNLFNDASVETMAEANARMDENIEMYKEFGDQIRSGARGIVDAFNEELKKQNPKTGAEVKALGEYWIKIYEDMAKGSADFRQEATKLGIEGINTIVNSMADLGKKTPLTTKEIDALNDAIRKQKQLIDSNVKSVNEYVKEQQDLLGLFVDFEIIEKVNVGMQELNRQFSREQSETPIKTFAINIELAATAILKASENADELKDSTGKLNKEVTDGTEAARQWYESWEEYGYKLVELFDSISYFFKQQEDYKLQVLQERLDKGTISEGQYDKDVKEIQIAQAKRAKLLSVFDVLAKTPPAIMQGFAQLGPVGAILAAALGVTELAAALATPIPAFKTGVVDFKGKGTGTSDDNLVRISNRESIITAKGTAKHKAALEAINKDRFDEYIANIYLKNAMKEKTNDDNYREYLELKRLGYINQNGFKSLEKVISEINRPHRF